MGKRGVALHVRETTRSPLGSHLNPTHMARGRMQ
ncbi:uncharacterized protein G2W53_026589 [Senna tora]|uniref:Uncharacterized protein n=1 Tax=Senna tora TaxID=362788 RepID=A0A834WLE4_9FABA|nr:uncharacterized protein G2W53_026589 [Senna tora]